MPLTLRQVHPRLAAAARAQIGNSGSRMSDESRTFDTRHHAVTTLDDMRAQKRDELTASAAALVTAVFVVFLYINACLHMTGAVVSVLITFLPLFFGVLVYATETLARRVPALVPVRRKTLLHALQQAAKTPAERCYSDALLLLTQTRAPRLQSRRLRRALLSEMNRLLEHSYRLSAATEQVAAQLQHAAPEMPDTADIETTHEYDPIVRESRALRQSLRQARDQERRALQRALPRLEAHATLVNEALAYARDALTRADTTSAAAQSPDVTALRAAADKIARDSAAAEAAAESAAAAWQELAP